MLGSACPAVNFGKAQGVVIAFAVKRIASGSCGTVRGQQGQQKNADRLIEICGVVAICMELPRSADYVDKRALCNAKCL